VVGADQQFLIAAARGEFMSAVLAYIIESLNLTIARARDNDVLVIDLKGMKISGFANLTRMAGEQPVFEKHFVDYAPVKLGVVEVPGIQSQ
jgi:hypothetical protein